jgi:hypothetical protein
MDTRNSSPRVPIILPALMLLFFAATVVQTVTVDLALARQIILINRSSPLPG